LCGGGDGVGDGVRILAPLPLVRAMDGWVKIKFVWEMWEEEERFEKFVMMEVSIWWSELGVGKRERVGLGVLRNSNCVLVLSG
jgi:hypothetical protein